MYKSKNILLDQITPVEIYNRVKKLFKDEISFLFESAINNENGNYSFIIIGARERVWHKDGKSYFKDENAKIEEVNPNPFLFLKDYYKNIDRQYYKDIINELQIGYVDGFIGYVGYDMVKEFEPVLKASMDNLKDDLNQADLDLIRPKLVLAYSHKSSRLTMVSFVESFISKFNIIENTLFDTIPFESIIKTNSTSKPIFAHTKSKFFDMIDKSKEMIKSGDVFQILMTNRFTHNIKVDSLSFYRVLKSKNPSPYMFLLDFEEFSIAGSSPEVMVGLSNNEILLRPIAGTRKRGSTKARDKELELEMLHDTKEKAEHLMLVDLGRNDVGRVARAGSVSVPNLMRVERYSHVMHMVSDVNAQLDDKYDMFDLFMATFTAGTMTGAPKVRAMQLIAEYEQLKRGFYSGSIGYFGFDGNMDSSITIRTAFIDHDKIVIQAGAGVVADSINELEYLEVQNKMKALISSLDDLII